LEEGIFQREVESLCPQLLDLQDPLDNPSSSRSFSFFSFMSSVRPEGGLRLNTDDTGLRPTKERKEKGAKGRPLAGES
jgi:hypothetical protein